MNNNIKKNKYKKILLGLYFVIVVAFAIGSRMFFSSGSNSTPVNKSIVVQKGDTKYYNEVFAQSDKCVLLIGDSYGISYLNDNNEGWIGWAEQFKQLFPMCNCYTYPVGGAGLVKGDFGFKKQLSSIIEEDAPKEVTDIVIIGGYNEVGKTEEELGRAMQEFVSLARSNWPDVLISYMFVPRSYIDIEKSNELINYQKIVRSLCKEYDVLFVDNAMNILDSQDDMFFSENDINSGYHPSTKGSKKIAESIAEYILTGDLQ